MGCWCSITNTKNLNMKIQDVAVLVGHGEACAGRVHAAAIFCHHFDAHLTGVYSATLLSSAVGRYNVGTLPKDITALLKARAQEHCDEAEASFVQTLKQTAVSGEFRSVDDSIVDALAAQSRFTDLLIAPYRFIDQSSADSRYQVADLLLSAASPVLLIAEFTPTISLPLTRVLLGWDGSRECARALSAALPVMVDVQRVDVVCVASNNARSADIATHLKRHGIDAAVHEIEGARTNAGSVLLESAEKFDSQLLIMGAYGHSRLRESVLGGATKHVLENAQLPVIFAH
ncbi:MAG: nucleotide-binding universal stress UspA family protein [Gammaproteobacteria bacterium]|jgi:nucleotide-binding universal stress UspA family protein